VKSLFLLEEDLDEDGLQGDDEYAAAERKVEKYYWKFVDGGERIAPDEGKQHDEARVKNTGK